ncbi:putative HTH-type transcriptional regulator YcgE [Catellatospora sp. IY07-71]|uniref:MarR family winged helix-turn-helix transcriptional regulator n=1 Tax=Catellatospora sp. IY07-71 TaxID=2728827 RepID=UPI001BB5C5C1|nr:MarR family transcriptional regulator [Catellatospora sp. IY07-71]BCJ70940.1 putative HTH-type transcriptional regulator YcgE [Catellatospora sp. IY07-71]
MSDDTPPKGLPAGAHEAFRRHLDAVTAYTQAAADAAGMHPTDWAALSVLNLAGRLTSGELAERTGLTTGATTRLIDRLERAGHVRRNADPADRRRVLVEPVPALDVGPIVDPARQRLAEVFRRYRPEELAVLFDYFGHAADALLAATHEIRAQATGRTRP